MIDKLYIRASVSLMLWIEVTDFSTHRPWFFTRHGQVYNWVCSALNTVYISAYPT